MNHRLGKLFKQVPLSDRKRGCIIAWSQRLEGTLNAKTYHDACRAEYNKINIT